jgi:hypothetical protein
MLTNYVTHCNSNLINKIHFLIGKLRLGRVFSYVWHNLGKYILIFCFYFISSNEPIDENNTRHTITIHHLTFSKLRSKGRFGESYGNVISRLIDTLEAGNNTQQSQFREFD